MNNLLMYNLISHTVLAVRLMCLRKNEVVTPCKLVLNFYFSTSLTQRPRTVAYPDKNHPDFVD